MTRAETNDNKKKLWLKRALIAVFALIFIVCAVLLVQQIVQKVQDDNQVDTFRDLYGMVFATAYAEEAEDEDADSETDLVPDSAFDELLEINSETVGWLEVGEDIAYPVVQQDNNTYYLEHDFYGESSSSGSIMMDKANDITQDDEHIIIYGHNMKSGAMFAKLKSYRTLSYLQEYPIFTFNTLYEEGRYAIVAVYDVSASDDNEEYMVVRKFNFDTDEDWEEFVNEALEKSYFTCPIDIERGDQLVSLVTCSYSIDDGRLIVMARKLRDDESEEDIIAAYAALQSE